MALIMLITMQVKPDLLNTVFSVFDGFVLPNMGTNLYPDIFTIEFNTSGIIKLLSKLDPSKSLGPDHIPAR